MSANLPTTPQGPVPAIGIPDSWDYPRLVYVAPYFQQVPLAELIEPAVIEAVESALPALVPPYVDQAAQNAVNQYAVLLTGSTMTGRLFLSPLMPTQPSEAATMAYVDAMIATAGIPEVPPVPSGQVWARETGQWVPITPQTGVFLPLAGGSMTGNISMSGNTINNLAAVPSLPNGAAPAQWVLNQIASVSLFQGQWDADTNVPDLTQLSVRVNGYTWIAITTSVSGVVVGQAIPGLQGKTIFNGDTIYYSTVDGAFFAIHAGGLTLPEAQSLFVLLAGSQMSGPLLLNADASQPLQAVTLQQLQAFVPPGAVGEAPNDGQLYGRNGLTASWAPVLPLAGGILTGALTLAGNATGALNPVPLQQMNTAISSAVAGYLPLAGNTAMTGLFTLSGNATANLNPVPLQQVNSMLATYAPLQNPAFTGVPTAPTPALPVTNAQQVATAGFVTSQLGNYLPLTGGTLAGPGNLTIDGILNIGTSGMFNLSDNPGANLRTLSWATGWADNFNSATGLRAWSGIPAGTIMTCDGSGNFSAAASVSAPTVSATTLHLSNFLPALWELNGPNVLFQYNASYYWFWNTTSGVLTWQGPSGFIQIDGTGGNLTASGTITQGSDANSKNTIAAYAPGVSIVAQLLPKTFIYNGDSTNAEHLGFIAQDVQPILAQAVGSTTHAAPGGDEVTTLNLDVTAIVAVLANATKQLISRVAALESNANITPTAAETA